MSRELKLAFQLHAKQVLVHQCPSPFKVVLAGRGWGKSRFAAIDAVLKGMEEVNWSGRILTPEAEVMYMAPTFEQAKGMFWPILKEVADPVIDSVLENVCLMTLVNGVRIRLKGMDNPDRARGFILRHAIMDEFADMHPSAWDVITAPSVMKTNGTALFIGTPKKGKPHLGQMLEFARQQPVDEKWGFPRWAGFQFPSSSNPFLDQDAIDAISANMSHERMREELEAEVLTEGGNFLLPEWWKYDTREPEDGFFVVAVDLGGFTSAPREKTKERRDDTAIAIVKIHRLGWWVKEIQYGRWDTRETVVRVVQAFVKSGAQRLGVEKGALFNAIWPYLREVMVQYGKFAKVEPLVHGNQHKTDRVMTSLEGRLQRGRITLNANEDVPMSKRPDWVQKLVSQAADFPSPYTHDDLVDALAYIEQLGQPQFQSYDAKKYDSWEPVDPIAGI